MTKKPLVQNSVLREEEGGAPHVKRRAQRPARKTCMRVPRAEIQNAELKRALTAMEGSRDHYLDLYDRAPVGHLTLGFDGAIREANLTSASLLGADRGELVKRGFVSFVADGDKERWWRLFPLELEQGRHRVCEMSLVRCDGRVFQAVLDCAALPSTDGPQFCVAMIDITERRNLEKESLERRKELNELQKLQVAAQTASAIAHELNQPLLAIASYSRAALMMLKSEAPDFNEICSAIEGSERQVRRAEESIREMFEFLNSNEFPMENFDLIQEIVVILEDARKEHELSFQSSLRVEGKLPSVRANRTHVQKALFNLLHNGIEAALQESRVPSPIITMTVGKAEGRERAHITVQDNGPGFSPEDAAHLFEPFYTTKGDGFGMGLTISRSLIEMNGGELWVAPQEGPGAVFHLTLPFAA